MNKNIQEKINEGIRKYQYAKFLRNGRNLEEGIDCLGFIKLFYKDFGIDIPSDDGKPIEEEWYRTDPERYIRGIKSLGYKNVSIDELQPLDLAYFVISHDVITHAGIMISNREFVHMSPKSGLLISKLERHWGRRFRGAIRLIE
ncbi:NlpC/P60 family protein [Proteiniborus sp. MB09-C3]|uniref:C40 family peptidase n=1 Tax=Proteiniborus sp. MB09-C3 TaxID=3050072 RepID=UPI002554C71C|nr:NlpC/P60 family protein [Proteiniborus sp. MB09-C3]WIV13257.1 NlpC/P60 family protein [Proteiniborus sp. MB09-C3]